MASTSAGATGRGRCGGKKREQRQKQRYRNSSSENELSPVEEDEVVSHTLEGGNSDVWDNLREIFQDIDAQDGGSGNGDCNQILKKPVKKLRHLLALHTKLLEQIKGDEELQLEKLYLGIRVEREWYLRKLQAIEVAIGPPPSQAQLSSEHQSKGPPNFSFNKAIHTILYEDNDDYTLVGSKWGA